MSPFHFFLITFVEILEAAGQLFLKHAMTLKEPTRSAVARVIALAIGCKAAVFFLWLGLLQQFDLSLIYPFDAINRPMVVLGASYFLKERVSAALWVGVVLITIGVALVSATSPPETNSKKPPAKVEKVASAPGW